MIRHWMFLAVLALFAQDVAAQPTLVIQRDASTTPVTVPHNGRLMIPLNFQTSTLDLRAVVTHANPTADLTLTTTFSGPSVAGLVASEWQGGPTQSQPLVVAPTSGTFTNPGTIQVTWTASDGTDSTVSNMFLDVVNASQFLMTNFSGNSFNGALTSSAMFDVAVASSNLNVTDLWASFSTLIGAGTSDVKVYYRTGSYVGAESSSAGWTLHQTLNAVAAQHIGRPVRLPIAPLALASNTTYGFAITATNSPNGPFCASGGGTTSSTNLAITTGAIVADPFLGGATTVIPGYTISMALGYEIAFAPTPEIDVERPLGTSLGEASGGAVTDNLGSRPPLLDYNFTYVIKNLGSADLNAGMMSILNQSNCSALLLSNQPATIAPGNSISRTVQVMGSSVGAGSFTIRIPNDDSNENPYDIDVSITFVDAPAIVVTPLSPATGTGASVSVPGASAIGSMGSVTLDVSNVGSADLVVTSIAVTLEDGVFGAIAASSPTSFTVAPGAAPQAIQVDYHDTFKSAWILQVTIYSNDPALPAFTVTISPYVGGVVPKGKDDKCSTSEQSGSWLMMAALLGGMVLAVRLRKTGRSGRTGPSRARPLG